VPERKISVIIPCFNCAKNIRRVLDGVIQQSLKPHEVICVDDASTDNTVDILKTLDVHLVCHSSNQGPAAARNTGFYASSGDLVVFLDSDAVPSANMIQWMVNVYDEHHDEKLAGVGGRGIETIHEGVANQWRIAHASQNWGNRRKRVPYLYGLCCSFKREAFAVVGGFDPYFRINSGEDVDLGFRLQKAGYYLIYDPLIYIHHYHRDTPDSVLRVQFNWILWNLIALQRNKRPIVRALLGAVGKSCLFLGQDLLRTKNLDLLQINILIWKNRIEALKVFFREYYGRSA